MAQVYFHCSNAQGVLTDRCGAAVDDLDEAREHAATAVRSLTMISNPEDWQRWVMHVSDSLGEEIFVMPFVFVLSKQY
ncbi:DUF6894 family protein [Bradyrhizobium japonicum]|uniref:DUF6894 family protein n=1 Tax=Bradyrhizobium japonicum TaxID=375 RepID=UPI0005771060|nr:hypothetical protein [Bradyrhizobium japonicum]